MENIDIASACILSDPGEIEKNILKTEQFLKLASEKNTSLVVFPEMNITGYTSGKELEETAVVLDKNLEKRLSDFSVKYNIAFLCGIAEKDSGCTYASHLFIDQGKIKGKYQKLQPGPPELGYITPGEKIPVFEFQGWNIGVQLCFDAHFPDISTIMARQGADIIIVPHASPRGSSEDKLNSWKRHLVARAYDNGLYVLAVNQCGKNSKNLFFPGISLLISPSGLTQEVCLCQEESLFYFKLSKSKIEEVKKHRMKNFLKYRRDDFYRYYNS
ncbi:MAG: nitrilase-related carbon-nitrogen hydrolase [Thermodesulfobacteriota bacterium]